MKFSKEFMQNLAWEDHEDDVKIITNELTSTSRWSLFYDLIFKYQGKFYRSTYSKGATEQQDERPYEYEGDEIECSEVYPVEETVIVYKKKSERIEDEV